MKAHFEGWYFKLIDQAEKNIYAIIPGVSFDERGSSHCFIQVLNGTDASSHYIRYDISSFRYSQRRFEICVGQSIFSRDKINLSVSGEGLEISGSLDFRNLNPWPSTITSPGAMGWYAFVPFMECYHGIVSFDHEIKGSLKINGSEVDFSGGRGYIEKDWGRSFPQYYAWAQSNHFAEKGISIMLSIANIPWLGKSFDGFMVGFWHKSRLYRFTSYNGAKLVGLDVKPYSVSASFLSGKYLLQIEAHKADDAALAAPKMGAMNGRIAESMTSKVLTELQRLSRGRNEVIFKGEGRHAGLEIAGEISRFPRVRML